MTARTADTALVIARLTMQLIAMAQAAIPADKLIQSHARPTLEKTGSACHLKVFSIPYASNPSPRTSHKANKIPALGFIPAS
jgi:hypothetical protein